MNLPFPQRWTPPFWPSGCLWLALLAPFLAAAQETEVQMLSGSGKDDAIPWNFFCTSGAQSGYWTNLPVPSNWELHGFGTLTYHRDATNAYQERGLYQHDFTVPANWAGQRVFLVFDGVMTDTSARLNGQPAGPLHQGGYYPFRYEVTSQLRFGATNRLEVTVAKHSANASVNGAERTGDYWMYGGIYRAVRLEAFPAQFIDHVAIAAGADGEFQMDVFLNGLTQADTVEAQLQTADGVNVGRRFQAPLTTNARSAPVRLVTRLDSPVLWSAETPHLYRVVVRLQQGGQIIHQISQPFGFRTFEVRDGDGLYLNGHRIILNGCNRHSFWPDSGRCLSEAVQQLDIRTMKDMNMSAVRMSHYPPDAAFLDDCDRLGLYVLDELAGWHKYYDTATGTRLVAAMVQRDVNHPSILFWDNGNEGGFNTNLDHLFTAADPQGRRVLHPWAPFAGLNTVHYLPYDDVRLAVQGIPISFHKNHYLADTNSPRKLIYMPTEFLHGLFDGGAGAGLADTWALMQQSPYFGGGFIWAYLDEGVRHPPTGEIDVCGNEAPDGIVGPYREREASFYAIKQIWTPVAILDSDLSAGLDHPLTLANHFSFTDASQCHFHWQVRQFRPTSGLVPDRQFIVAEGSMPAPSIPPGGQGSLTLPPECLRAAAAAPGGCLALRVAAPDDRELWTYVWPLPQNQPPASLAPVVAQASQFGGTNTGTITLTGANLVIHLDARTGTLLDLKRAGRPISLTGPRPADTNSPLTHIRWQLRADGGLQCDYAYTATGPKDYFGVVFDYPEKQVTGKRWLGDGPYRVWKNRRAGVTPGLWQNAYNNTITGWHDWVYPEFKGCFASVRWLELATTEGHLTLVNQSAVPFVQVLTPEFPPVAIAGHTIPTLPTCGLGLLDAIPPMGSKFQPPAEVSPAGTLALAQGNYTGTVRFYFTP